MAYNNDFKTLQDWLMSAFKILTLDNETSFTTDEASEALADRVASGDLDWKTFIKDYRYIVPSLSQESLEFFNEVLLKAQALLQERGVKRGGTTLQLPKTPYALLGPFLFLWVVADCTTGKVITPKPLPWFVLTKMYPDVPNANVLCRYRISERTRGADSNDASVLSRLVAVPVCLRLHLLDDMPMDELLYALRKTVKSMTQNVKELRLLDDGTFLLVKVRSGLQRLSVKFKGVLPTIPNDSSDECMVSVLNSIFKFPFCKPWSINDYKYYLLEYPVRPTSTLEELMGIGKYVEQEYVEIPTSVIPLSLRNIAPIY